MLPQSDPVWVVLIFGTFICLLFVGFIFVFVSRYQQKMFQHQLAILRQDEAHQLAQLAAAMEGQEREQRRLGLELHDGVGADLSFIKNMLLRATTMEDKVAASGLIAEAADALNKTFLQVRQISHKFIPRVLEYIGLQGALREMCKLVSSSGLIKATFEAPENLPQLPIEKQLLLYRIVQELVQNAVKHAKAKSIVVKLEYNNNQFLTTVQDDGCGFDADAPQGFGIGFKNIDTRTKLLEADLDMATALGRGTTAIVKFKHT